MEEGEQRFPACEKLRVDNGEEEKENNWQFVRFFFSSSLSGSRFVPKRGQKSGGRSKRSGMPTVLSVCV